MDELLHYYEQELGRLREAARRYADAHPGTAAALELGPDASTDPEVERLLQSVALLNATMQKRIEDGRSELHKALLQSLQTHYLRPIPACGIVQVDTSGAKANEISSVTRLPRGAILRSGMSKFATAYEVCVAPIAIAEARLQSTIDLPPTLRLPGDATSALVISLEANAGGASFDQPPLDRLRMYVDGEPALRAALLDAILAHCQCVCLEVERSWRILARTPFGACGSESLLPIRPGPQSPRLMSEFFQLPQMFHFVDLDLAAIAVHCPPRCKRITLHVVLPGCNQDLRKASPENIQLGCTPVVNLFEQAGAPIRLDGRAGAYPVMPNQPGYEIYSVDSVALMSQGGDHILPPFHGIAHVAIGPYWKIDEQEGGAISFVDREQHPAKLESGTIAVQLSCTNRDPIHCAAMLTAEACANSFPIHFKYGPIRPQRLTGFDLLCASLYEDGVTLHSLRTLLELHGCDYTNVLKALVTKPSTAWLEHPMGRLHMHGSEFTVVVDEPALRGHSIHALSEVLASCLADKLRENRFAQVRIVNEDGRILRMADPRVGTRRLS